MSAFALVIGSGPAGLMAAEELALAGVPVVVAESKPSVGRKFLMAGKSGLNLTKIEAEAEFLSAYGAAPLTEAVQSFGPKAVCTWTEGLGQEVFTGSSGRVFPTVMKASPLLRAWLGRLSALGVEVKTRWRWTGWSGPDVLFEMPDGPQSLTPVVTVLALGGASWARLGSDGAWAEILAGEGVPLAPFRPANMGFLVPWSKHMTPHFGAPLKGIALNAGADRARGECVISSDGIEGGVIYTLSAAIRDGAPATLDLLPDLSLAEAAKRLSRPRGKATMSNHLRKVLRLGPVKLALVNELARPLPGDPAELAGVLKALPLPLTGPRPMDEAISTAGGVMWEGLTPDLELRAKQGVFCAGEMLDWEAPTGGYLITGCLATGRQAGQAAAAQF